MKNLSSLATLGTILTLAGCTAEHTPAGDCNNECCCDDQDTNNQGSQQEQNGRYPTCTEDVLAEISQTNEQIQGAMADMHIELPAADATGIGDFAPVTVTVDPDANRVGFGRAGVDGSTPEYYDPRYQSLGVVHQLSPFGNAALVFRMDGSASRLTDASEVMYDGGNLTALTATVTPGGAFQTNVVCTVDEGISSGPGHYTGYIITFDPATGKVTTICQQPVRHEYYHDLASEIHDENKAIFQSLSGE